MTGRAPARGAQRLARLRTWWRNWPRVPTFGAPCPTTLFTAGSLLAAVPPTPRWLFTIPVLWSLVGGSAALLLGVVPGLMLFAAGAGLLVFAVARWMLDRRRAR